MVGITHTHILCNDFLIKEQILLVVVYTRTPPNQEAHVTAN